MPNDFHEVCFLDKKHFRLERNALISNTRTKKFLPLSFDKFYMYVDFGTASVKKKLIVSN